MTRGLAAIVALVSLVTQTGCATILNDDTQMVAFDSEPIGATVAVDGVRMGVTPCALPIERKGWDKTIQIEKPGYKTEIFVLDNVLSGSTFLNVLWFPGAIVDGISGRGGKYKDTVKVVLEPGQGINDRRDEGEEDNGEAGTG